MGLRDYEASIKLFKKSIDLCGEHYVTWHNLGICYYYNNNINESLSSFNKCLEIQPDYQDAKYPFLYLAYSQILESKSGRKGDFPVSVFVFVCLD